MKWFSLFIFLILQSFKSVPIDSEESRLINPVKYWMDKLKKEIIELITPLINLNEDDNINNNTFEKFDVLYDLIESLDQECFDFIIDLYFGEKDLLQNAAKILFKEGGFIQISVGIENDCISDGTYIMFTSNDTIYKLRKDTRITAKEAIFKETFDWQKEVCLLNECRHLYARLIKYLLKYHENYFFDLLDQNGVNISWINFYDIDYEADNATEMFEYKKNKIESEKFMM